MGPSNPKFFYKPLDVGLPRSSTTFLLGWEGLAFLPPLVLLRTSRNLCPVLSAEDIVVLSSEG